MIIFVVSIVFGFFFVIVNRSAKLIRRHLFKDRCSSKSYDQKITMIIEVVFL